MNFLPKNDGIDHINIYSQGQTKIGQLLSNFAHTPFRVPLMGTFQSVEGFWYYCLIGKKELKNLVGFEAKQFGKRHLKIKDTVDSRLLEIAYRAKLRDNLYIIPKLLLMLHSKLQIAHYYVYGGKAVTPKEFQWIAELWKEIPINILPTKDKVFRALTYFKPQQTKAIIIGQDPYPNPEDACGLAFSVEHNKPPASLKNIFKELKTDLNINSPKTGNLEPWAKQGVLLLNSVLTTEKGKSGAHKNIGWEEITTNTIQKALDCKQPIVIIAWGFDAKKKLETLKLHDKVLVLTGGHPSPLNTSVSFLGGKYFSKANAFLNTNGIKEIDWRL